jgi:hypothetical protein
MISFPKTDKELKKRISSYKSSLSKEKKNYGYIRDGSGKRYVLFYLYFVLNDLAKSEANYEWYQKEFPDDSGEPVQKLCWAISLHRMGKELAAKQMLGETMLSNLYLLPFIIGETVEEYDIWHASNFDQVDYVNHTPDEVIESIRTDEALWIKSLYESFEFRRIRKRYIAIYHKLLSTRQIEARRKLLEESYSLLDGLQGINR